MLVPRGPLSHTLSTLIALMPLQMIQMASNVEVVLREAVLQVEHVGEKKLCMLLFFSSMHV